MEECPQHIRLVVGEARQFWPGMFDFQFLYREEMLMKETDVVPSDTSQLGECEFSIIAELNSQLIVHHPYRSLTELQTSLQLTLDETSLAWNIINDHYLCDLPLLHPPHVIAVTAAFLAVVLKPTQTSMQMHAGNIQGALQNLGSGQAGGSTRVQKMLNWLAESSVSIEAMVDCTQELISLYEVWDQYKESLCKEPLARLIKGRGMDK
jgi:cyclin C